MKKNNKVFVIGISLALALFALDSCKSSTVTEPSPVGPSSIAVILSLTASPNAMFAGHYVRETSTITATLKKYDGIPLAGTNVLFTIESARGSLGYFEDEMNSLTAATDAEGTIQLTYYGPLYDELSRSMEVLIKAEVAWDGAQTFWGSTPIHIVHGEE
jgi:hypothetical protein